ncbi:hypothetical protein F5Y12DRAFT_763882 [Xylaria sp. FL1777]|nr:hypothetical protein F5Y12DRAFT_763882 [Xylaria sp. FL1777]
MTYLLETSRSGASYPITMPSGTEQAKEKFMQGIEKTRASAEAGSSSGTQGDSMPGKKADNPKQGWFTSKLAKGDTESSNYNPGSFTGNSSG